MDKEVMTAADLQDSGVPIDKALEMTAVKPSEDGTPVGIGPGAGDEPEATGEKPAAEGEKPVAAAAEGAPAGEPAAPAYTPNFKFTVMDKEHEVPEMLRGLMKDEESSKQVLELMQKSIGLDYHKPRYEKLKHDYTQTQAGVETLHGFVQNFAQKGDVGALDNFFQFWGLDQKAVTKYLAEKFRYEEMNEQERAQYDYQRQRQMQFEQTQRQNMEGQNQLLETQAQLRTMQLDIALQDPSMAESIKAYDAKVGTPGAFKQEVIRQGQLAYFNSGRKKDLTVQEAIEAASHLLKLVGPPAPAAAAPASAPQVVAPVAQKKLPVIPNLGAGGGTSPVRKQINSVDDLRARRKALLENQQQP